MYFWAVLLQAGIIAGYEAIIMNKRIGKIAVTAIVGIISAISGIASVEMIKSIKKETEKAKNVTRKSSDE